MNIIRTTGRSVALVALATCLWATAIQGSQNPGAVFLMVWPTARSTALAGAMTGLADDADAAYWNPGGLGFQEGIGGSATFCNWLPGLYEGMYYAYASAGIGGLKLGSSRISLNVGTDFSYLTTGKTDVVNERGEFLGRYTTYDMSTGLHAAAGVTRTLGLGLNLKYIRSFLAPEWVWKVMPELGIEQGGTGNDVAIDVGALYKPVRPLSVGLTIANLGPNISYTSSGEADPLPLMLRLGGCLTPVDDPLFRLRLLLETDKILVGMFYDTTGTKTFARKIQEELRDAWKSAAAEVTLAQVFSVRAGYFEDLTGQRGGVVMENESQTYHYGLYDVLTRRNLGTLKSVGLCLGIAASYKDHVRLDVSSDSLIYDFPTANTKISLTVNDVGGMIEDLTSDHLLDWMH